MMFLQILSCLALVVCALSQTTTVTSESGRVLCTEKDRIRNIVHEYGKEVGYVVEDVLLNCCVEEPDTSLRKAVVSAFINANGSSNPDAPSNGVRLEFLYELGTVIVIELEGSEALNFTWNGTHCFECNTSAMATGDELCSECHEFCVSCNGSANSEHECQRCMYSTNETAKMDGYCLNNCTNGFDQIEGCKNCSGVLCIIGPAEMEAAEGSHEGGAGEGAETATYLQFEYKCVSGCPPGQTERAVSGSPTDICFAHDSENVGILFCNVSQGMDCVACYGDLILMQPLTFEARIRAEALEKVEELVGHFEENCLDHARCLTAEQSEECFEEYIRIQSEILREEIEAEEISREQKDLALKTALPITCGLVIIIFVSLSVFAHYRYPHVSASGEKRHRKKDETVEEEVIANQPWRPRPTIRYR